MICKFFTVAALAIPAGLYAQTQPASPQQAPAQSGSSANIYVAGGGVYGGAAYVVPGGTGPAGTSTGISLAGKAGITVNQPIDLGVQSTLAPTSPPIAYGYGFPGAASVSSIGVTPAEETRRPDMGSWYVEGSVRAPSMSLGEISAQYRANRPQNVRMYTNADAERLAHKISVGGAPITENAQSPSAPPVVAENRPAPAPIAPSTTPEASATTPEINPPSSAETPTTRLPATSSFLPLLGLLGLLSGGIGLWVRRLLK